MSVALGLGLALVRIRKITEDGMPLHRACHCVCKDWVKGRCSALPCWGLTAHMQSSGPWHQEVTLCLFTHVALASLHCRKQACYLSNVFTFIAASVAWCVADHRPTCGMVAAHCIEPCRCCFLHVRSQ